MLQIDSVSKFYGAKSVLDNVSFYIPTGQVWSLLGINGAGKSTLLKIICHLIAPDCGNVLFDGVPVDPQNGNLGYMIETPCFVRDLTGWQNIKALSFLYEGIDNERIDEVLSIVGLDEQKKVLFKRYSTGMKQRLYLAYAILNRPKLLILDEPFNGLDPVGIASVQQLIRDYANDGGTVLVAGHNIAELQAISDGVVIIDHGKVLFVENNIADIDLTALFLRLVSADGKAQ